MSRSREKVRLHLPLVASLCTAAASSLGLLALAGCGAAVGFSSTAAPGTGTSSSGSTGNATASLRQSQLGYIWLSRDQTLRPLLGAFGAAYFGESLTAGGAYLTAAASPASQTALLLDKAGQLSRMSLPDGALTSLGSIGADAATRIRFSPSGTSAIAFVPGASSVAVLTALRSATPRLALYPSAVSLADVAVSDAGSVVALAQSQGRSTVTLLHSDGSSVRIALLSGSGSLAFVGTNDDLLVADAAANSLTLTHNVSSAPSPVSVNAAGLLKTPVALGVAPAGRWAVAVNSAESSIVRIDLSGQTAPVRLTCPLQPAFAQPLALGAFQLSSAGSAPAWVADITATSPALFFIPALPASASAAS